MSRHVELTKLQLRHMAKHFDATGDVTWYQSGRATITGLTMTELSEENARLLSLSYGGRIEERRSMESWSWRVSGRDAQRFAEDILPFCEQLYELLSFFIVARRQIIFSGGVGRNAALDRTQLDFRIGIAEELHKLRKAANLPRGNRGREGKYA